MSLPKEPRQKMINMMYLVLTALLALNVSAEIINAFRTVNNSITNANGVIDNKNKSVYSSFEELVKDPKTAEKAKVWQPFAAQAQSLSNNMDTYINNVKLELKKEADLKVENGVETFKEDNLDASTRLFDTKGKGEELYKKLKDYKQNLLATLDPAKFSDPIIKKGVAQERVDLEKSLPLDLRIPKSESANSNNNWTNAYFHMTPTIAALTILSKFQNDVKNSESQVVDYFLSQVGSVKVVFDEFQPLVGTSSTYLMPGEDLEITAGVGAYSKAAKPSISIGGTSPALNSEGTAVYKTTVSGAGEKSVAVNIKYTKSDGSIGTLNKVIKYTVGVPSGSSVFLEKMNVLYRGVENPVHVSAGSAGLEKMSVGFTAGTITSVGAGRYIIKPTALGNANINVTVNGKTTPFAMRVKSLPDPTALVGGSKGGSFSSANFKAQGGLIARLLESDFEAPYQVVSYTIGANGGPFQTYQQATNDGARWTGSAASIISRATPGTSVFFDQIKVKGPDGVLREIPPIIFQLK